MADSAPFVLDTAALSDDDAVRYIAAVADSTVAFAGCACNFGGFTICLAHAGTDPFTNRSSNADPDACPDCDTDA